MTGQMGHCTNFGNCSLADSRKLLARQPGQDFVCPECGKGLLVAQARSGTSGKGILAAIAGLVVVAIVGGGVVLWGKGWSNNASPAAQQPAAPMAAAAKRDPQPAPPAATVILRLAGSNTVGAGLAPALAEAYLSGQGYQNIRRVPGSTPTDMMVAGERAGQTDAISIVARGTKTGFSGLLSNDADIAMASRRVSAEETSGLASQGDMTGPANEHVLALDGVAVVVNRSNPVSTLSKDKVAAIFNGLIKDWSQVGGTPGPIHVHARDDNSGTFDTFQSLVLGKSQLVAGAKRFEDSGELAGAVATDPAGIGFVGLAYVGPTKAVAIAEPDATPLVPNRFTVGTEDYPLARRLYLYTAAAPANPNVFKYVEFALSAAGQTVVEKSGFVPLTIRSEAVAASSVSRQFADLTQGAQRLSTNFRFVTVHPLWTIVPCAIWHGWWTSFPSPACGPTSCC